MTTATLAGGFTYFEGLQVTPNTGPESGGTEITILGAGFDETTTALIGNVPVEDLVLVDSATLTGTTGVSTYGVYDVVTTTGTVVTLVTNGFTYTVDNTFALTSISPNYGSAVGGNTVTFTGTCFDANTTFTIGGAAVTDVVIIDSNTATGTVPAGSAGFVNVAAQQGIIESTLTEAYQYIAISITTVSPSFDYAAGGAALVNPNIVSDTVITGTVPPGSLGLANVIATKGGSSFTTTDSFEYIAAFTATDIDPPDGFVVGGDAVTITGTGFASTCTASIGGNPCSSVVVVSSTTITAVTPPGTEGAKDVVLSQYGGTATIDDGFTYVIDPEDREGDKTIKETYDGLMFLPGGLQSTTTQVLDANGNVSPLAMSDKDIFILGNLCASGACLGYIEASGNVELQPDYSPVPMSQEPAGTYRNVPLALMLSQTLTPFHFGAKGRGPQYVEEDTAAFTAAFAFCSGSGRKLHIPYQGVGSYFCFNKTLFLRGCTVTSDHNANLVWIATDKDCAIQIGNDTIGEAVSTPQGHYELPKLTFSPKGTPDCSYEDVMNYTLVNPSDPSQGALRASMKVNNIGIKFVNTYGAYVRWNYIKGFSTSFLMTITEGAGGGYGASNVSANNIIDFVGMDVMNIGFHFDSTNSTSGFVGETLINGSTIGVVLQNAILITSGDRQGWGVHGIGANIAVVWMWRPANTPWTQARINNAAYSAGKIDKQYNKVNIVYADDQIILT